MNGSPNIMNNDLPEGSYFRVLLSDGNTFDERTTPWSAISVKKSIEYYGKQKTVFVCAFPVKQIDVFHEGLETSIEVPEGHEVYQAIRSKMDFSGGQSRSAIIGRCIGIIKDDKMVEERFLNAQQNEVLGVRA